MKEVKYKEVDAIRLTFNTVLKEILESKEIEILNDRAITTYHNIDEHYHEFLVETLTKENVIDSNLYYDMDSNSVCLEVTESLESGIKGIINRLMTVLTQDFPKEVEKRISNLGYVVMHGSREVNKSKGQILGAFADNDIEGLAGYLSIFYKFYWVTEEEEVEP